MKACWHPLTKYMTIVLSNGATVRMATACNRTRPFVANNDIFSHSVWQKSMGAEVETKKDVTDFSKFYKKFGYEDEGEQKATNKQGRNKLFR